jgi:hypothetical protein
LEHKPNDIWTIAFSVHVGPLWEANINSQFILDPYAIAIYCISYLTKVDKFVTWEMQIISNKCKCEETETSKWIKKLGNAFLNAQQMLIQRAVHICLSIPLYHSTRSFQFINTCQENDRAFVLLPQKILNKLSLTNIHCKSLIEKYIMKNQSLKHLSLAKFVVNYDIKSSKQCKHSTLYVGFHLIFIKIQKTTITYYYYYYFSLFMDQKIIANVNMFYGNMLISM